MFHSCEAFLKSAMLTSAARLLGRSRAFAVIMMLSAGASAPVHAADRSASDLITGRLSGSSPEVHSEDAVVGR